MTLLDVIGDIHGHATALEGLLCALGYERRQGAWRAPEGRCAAFVGDFIDGGPENLRVVEIVRAMCEAGSAVAVMGNHELNALQFHSTCPDSGRALRPHTEKNVRQHRAYLAEIAESEASHRDALAFFRTLPLWMEVGGVRVVHACWSVDHVDAATRQLGREGRLAEGDLARTLEGGDLHDIVETLLKSPELELPPGIGFHDRHGHYRTHVRLAWWRSGASTWRSAALAAKAVLEKLPEGPLPSVPLPIYGEGEPPVFFGHYRQPAGSRLAPLGGNTICVDYSVDNGGQLAAFRQTGPGAEGTFVSVSPEGT